MDRHWMDALSRLRALGRERRFGEALALIERLLQQAPISAELLVRRARLLQLASETDMEDPLAVVEESLTQACALAPEAIEPRIEMGHFLYAVKDRTADALGQFEAAERLARTGLKDALIGKIKCLAELGRTAEARVEMATATELFPDDMDVGVLQAELGDGAGEG